MADQVVADFPAVFFWLRQLIQMKIESTNKLIGHPNNQVVTTYKKNPLLFSDIHFTFAKFVICFIGSLMNFTIRCSFEDVKAQVPASLLLVTATDGNHGFGVAYLAKLFGCRAKVTVLSS